jgi:hypothetical protein
MSLPTRGLISHAYKSAQLNATSARIRPFLQIASKCQGLVDDHCHHFSGAYWAHSSQFPLRTQPWHPWPPSKFGSWRSYPEKTAQFSVQLRAKRGPENIDIASPLLPSPISLPQSNFAPRRPSTKA